MLLAPRRPDTWASAIDRLLDDADLRRAMGAAGRRAVLARFDQNRHAADVVALYRDTIASAARSANGR
jgi:glycosyltransferase involved in cell wall biosynthesis